MKDSGIEWIGEIPEGWALIRIKFCAFLRGRIGWQGLTSNEYIDEGPYLITGTDFLNGRINWDTCVHISPARYEEAPEIHVCENDLLITKDGSIGKVAIIDSASPNASLNSGVLLVRRLYENIYNTQYLYYVLTSDIFWMWYHCNQSGNSTISHLYQEKFKEFSFPLPNIIKQSNIARLLNTKCLEIDRIIQQQQAAIEKLKEYKHSIITEAVTKGLDPDVPMKNSGIEWIGRFPIRWCISKIGRVASTCSGATPNRDKHDDYFNNANVKWVRTLDLNDWKVWETSEYITDQALCDTNCSLMPTGTVMVAMYGGEGTIGKCGILMAEATTNQAVCSIICSSQVFPMYLLYTLLAKRKYWMKYAVGTRKDPNISQEIVSSGKICIPPLNEQMIIATYLEEKCQSINKAISHKESLMRRLKNYKKSLIYEAVTGKLEV